MNPALLQSVKGLKKKIIHLGKKAVEILVAGNLAYGWAYKIAS